MARPSNGNPIPLVQIRTCLQARIRVPNRRSTSVARATASGLDQHCHWPTRRTVAAKRSGAPDGLSRPSAEAASRCRHGRARGHSACADLQGRRPYLPRPGTADHFLQSLRISRARCRCSTPARAPGGCWWRTWTRAAATSTIRRPRLANCSRAWAPGTSPTPLRPAACASCAVCRAVALARAARPRPRHVRFGSPRSTGPHVVLGGQIRPRGPAQVRRLARALERRPDEARAALEQPNGPEAGGPAADRVRGRVPALETVRRRRIR